MSTDTEMELRVAASLDAWATDVAIWATARPDVAATRHHAPTPR